MPPAPGTAWEDRGEEEGQRPPGTKTGEGPGRSLGAGPMAPAGRPLSETPDRQPAGTPGPAPRQESQRPWASHQPPQSLAFPCVQ